MKYRITIAFHKKYTTKGSINMKDFLKGCGCFPGCLLSLIIPIWVIGLNINDMWTSHQQQKDAAVSTEFENKDYDDEATYTDDYTEDTYIQSIDNGLNDYQQGFQAGYEDGATDSYGFSYDSLDNSYQEGYENGFEEAEWDQEDSLYDDTYEDEYDDYDGYDSY